MGSAIDLPGGAVQHNITGGTRPGRGANLFHSFGSFDVPTAHIANFLNDSGLATTNILSRVTGGNPSNISGMIQTTGFGNANLFLMNPAGIVFGANASLNVGGSVSFTTADYLHLIDGVQFTAIPGPSDTSISSAPVAAFGFLGSNSGAITVQGGQLAVSEGHTISLIGGNIDIKAPALNDGTLEPSRLSASGGQINMASIASTGEVLYPSMQPSPDITGQPSGSITLSGESTLDVSGNSGGTIRIRGGELVITDGTLSANTSSAGASIAIDINVSGNLSLTDTRGLPVMTAQTSGPGDAGEVHIKSASILATSSFDNPDFQPRVLVDSHTSASGRGGNIKINTGDLNVSGTNTNAFTFIDSGITGAGRGGDMTITARNIQIDSATVSTGDFIARNLGLEPSGSAGNLVITANRLGLHNSILSTEAFGAFGESQQAGNITLNVGDVETLNSQISLIGIAHGGALTINADTIHADSTFFETDTVSGSGGGITVTARTVALTNGGALVSTTLGDGNAGDIQVTARDHVSLANRNGSDSFAGFQPSGLFSNSFGGFGTKGDAGNVLVTTPQLEMTGGRINTVTATSGHGGNVTLTVRDSISASGEFLTDPTVVPSIFDIGPLAPSGVVTQTIGNEFCSALCGNAGNIEIATGTLILSRGAQIDSGTSSTGQGGKISINATGSVAMSGTLSDGSPVGIFSRTIGTIPDSGTGGDIIVSSGRSFNLSNGASVSASSTGAGDAGNIDINAGSQFFSNNGAVTTQSSQLNGGNITVRATDSIRLVNSLINTSVDGGPSTVGGNITIDPALMTLQNSQILAQATQGSGGNINITAGTFLRDQTSLVDARSQWGLSGNVNIQSPLSSLSGTLATLAQRPQQAQNLLSQRCAAQINGRLSSFVVAGRDALPSEPGDWLMSPLLAFMADDLSPRQATMATGRSFEPPQRPQVMPGQSRERLDSSRREGITDGVVGCGS